MYSAFSGSLHVPLITVMPQNKEGILPVATLFIALYVPRRSRSGGYVAPDLTFSLSPL